MISDETTIADVVNNYFVNITKKLKLKPTENETERPHSVRDTGQVQRPPKHY